jgi:hypothetical protein
MEGITMANQANTTTTLRSATTMPKASGLPAAPSRQRITARSLASEIRGAHDHLIARLAAVPPNMINPFLQADEDDLELRADHLRIVLQATADYVSAFMRDTAYFGHAVQNRAQVPRRYLQRRDRRSVRRHRERRRDRA